VKAYVYFAVIAVGATACPRRGLRRVVGPGLLSLFATGCAFGQSAEQLQHHDAGVIVKADGGTKDAAKPQPDAHVEDTWVDPPDVQTTCSSLPLGTGMQQCDTCLGASCCSEDQTCGNDQECIAFIDCFNQCFNQVDGGMDQTCEQACENQYPNGVAELSNLDMCMQNSCGTECGI